MGSRIAHKAVTHTYLYVTHALKNDHTPVTSYTDTLTVHPTTSQASVMTSLPTSSVLHGAPTIQTRVSIARPPSPPKEDSDVLVLSSRSTLPDSSSIGSAVLYLDLRLLLPVTKTSSISWAFAGLRYTVPLLEEQPEAVRYRWEHTIDSHGRGEPPDEGTMVKRTEEDGEEVEVETGEGLNPDTGKMGPYEEVWRYVGEF